MTVKSLDRGHEIEYKEGKWIYSDTGEEIRERSCRNCGEVAGDVGIDKCIQPIVKALNEAGAQTIASCCGHGWRPGNIALKDGRELIISRNYEEARRIDKLFPFNICGERAEDIKCIKKIIDFLKKKYKDIKIKEEHGVELCL